MKIHPLAFVVLATSVVAALGPGRLKAQALDPGTLCSSRISDMLDALGKDDYVTAEVDFDAKLRASLPPEKLEQEWKSLTPKYGKITARGETHIAADKGYIAATVPLVFEKGTLAAQVACGDKGAVVGFHVVPITPKAQF
ncbi:MAG: DUF3887 domain-containing protein [Rhodanobacteraceae bacterium]